MPKAKLLEKIGENLYGLLFSEIADLAAASPDYRPYILIRQYPRLWIVDLESNRAHRSCGISEYSVAKSLVNTERYCGYYFISSNDHYRGKNTKHGHKIISMLNKITLA